MSSSNNHHSTLLSLLLLVCSVVAHADESYVRLDNWQVSDIDDPANVSASADSTTWQAVEGNVLPPPASGEVRWARYTLEPAATDRHLLVTSVPRQLQVWIDGELVVSEQRGQRRKPRALRVAVPPGATHIALRIEADPEQWISRQAILGRDLPALVGNSRAVDDAMRAREQKITLRTRIPTMIAALLGTTALLASFVYHQRRALTAFVWFALTCALLAIWFGASSAVIAGWFPYRWMNDLQVVTTNLTMVTASIYLARLADRPPPIWMRIAIGLELAVVAMRLLLAPGSQAVLPIAVDQLLLFVLGIGALLHVLPAARGGNRPVVAVLVGAFVAVGSTIVFIVAQRLGYQWIGAIQLSAVAFVLSMAVAMIFLLVDHAKDLDSAYDHLDRAHRSAMRFVPRSFLDHLGRESLPDVERGDAVERNMTVLFSDIRDFTSLSEGLQAREVFGLVNDYLGYVVPEIERNGGFIDKYIGDAVMALFDRPQDAVRAALACEQALARFNADQPEQADLRIGIGLHTGSLTLGTLGSEQRLSCTVIGDTVNVASRIESLTKHFGVTTLLSADTAAKLDGVGLQRVDQVQVKGRDEQVEVFALQDLRPGSKAEASMVAPD